MLTSGREGGAAAVTIKQCLYAFFESEHVRILSVVCAAMLMSWVLPSVTLPKNPKYSPEEFNDVSSLHRFDTHFYFHAFNRPNTFHFQMFSLFQLNVCCGPHNEAYLPTVIFFYLKLNLITTGPRDYHLCHVTKSFVDLLQRWVRFGTIWWSDYTRPAFPAAF